MAHGALRWLNRTFGVWLGLCAVKQKMAPPGSVIVMCSGSGLVAAWRGWGFARR